MSRTSGNDSIPPRLRSERSGRALLAFFLYAMFFLCLFCSCSRQREERQGPMVYRLKWFYNASVAGDIWADETGIFRSFGLNVKIKEGGPGQDAIKDVELQRAWFGVASADQVIRAVARGADIVVLAQIFQVNPLQWIYRANNILIKTPRDLEGLRIGITYGGNDEAIFNALAHKYGLPVDRMNLYAVHYDFTPFWLGKADLWPVYRNTQGIILSEKLKKEGCLPGFFNPNQFGIRFVANSLITSRRLLKEHPETVRRFTKAVLKGWSEAMDPHMEDKACRLIQKKQPDYSLQVLRKQVRATREMVVPSRGKIGEINREAWKQTARIMLRQKLIEHPVNVDLLFAPQTE